MKTKNGASVFGRRLAWAALLLLVMVGLAITLLPVWVIQPFRPQSQRELAFSYALRSWSPLVTLAAVVIAFGLVVWLWRGSRRWWRKAALIVVITPLLASAWLARQNHFEWMFKPLPTAAYARTGEAEFVAGTDMVMAVEHNGEAVAYPIRLMAYHHVVQDEVGGLPVVATY